jgi:ribosomal protein S18 acetylase RimI-like enzyme
VDGLAAFVRNTAGMLLRLPNYYSSAQASDEGGLIVVRAGHSAATFNGIMIRDHQAPIDPAQLAALHEEYCQAQLAYAVEVFSPNPVPDCDQAMVDTGYQRTSCDAIMYAEWPLNEATSATNLQVSVRPVTTDADRQDYKQVLMTVFSIPPGVSQDFFESMMSIAESRQMIAYLNGAAVGSGMLLYIDDTASIYNIATLPEVQHQGVGTAMMLALHRQALTDGFAGTGLSLQSSESQAFYTRLGYQQGGWRSTYEKFF